MERRLDDVIAALPEERRERVDARFEELKGQRSRASASCAMRLARPGRDCHDPQDQVSSTLAIGMSKPSLSRIPTARCHVAGDASSLPHAGPVHRRAGGVRRCAR